MTAATKAWKQETCQDIGIACMLYGTAVLITGATVLAAVFGSSTGLSHVAAVWNGWSVSQAAVAGSTVLGVFAARSRVLPRRVTRQADGVIAALSALFALPAAFIGALLLAATSDYAYSGIEKWLPEVQDRASHELSRVQQAVTELELSADVHDRILELLETARDKGLMRNRPFAEMLGAMIYIAGRDEQEPRSFGAIAAATGASKQRIGQAYRYIGRNTDAEIVPPRPVDYLSRFAEKLQLDDTVVKEAEEIIEAAEEQQLLSGKSPTGTAAAALFIAAAIHGDERNITEIADLLDVTVVTVRKRTTEFCDEMELDDVPTHIRQINAVDDKSS